MIDFAKIDGVTAAGIIYGFFLIYVTFARNKVTEAMRVDALFMREPSDKSRNINLVVGIALIAYNLYTVMYP